MNKQNWLRMLRTIFYSVLALVVIIQLVIFFNLSADDLAKLPGDPRFYMKLIDQKLAELTFYPSLGDLKSDFIWNPGFINVAILLKLITGSHKGLIALNIVLYLSCGLIIKKIGKIILNDSVGYLSGILYFTYLNNIFFTPFYLSQFLFIFLLLIYLLILFSQINHDFASLGSGIILAFANWIRPFGTIVLISSLFVFINKRKIGFRKPVFSLLGYFLILIVIGLTTKYFLGHFVYQSTTSGITMRMGAMDGANGKYKESAFSIDKISDSLDFHEREKIRKENAIAWIIGNKFEYIKLAPKKMFSFFQMDTYSFNSLDVIFGNYLPKHILFWIKKIVILISYLRYFFIFFLLPIGLFFLLKAKINYAYFFLSFSIFSMLITTLTIGETIYRHGLIILSHPIIASGIYFLFFRKKIGNEPN